MLWDAALKFESRLNVGDGFDGETALNLRNVTFWGFWISQWNGWRRWGWGQQLVCWFQRRGNWPDMFYTTCFWRTHWTWDNLRFGNAPFGITRISLVSEVKRKKGKPLVFWSLADFAEVCALDTWIEFVRWALQQSAHIGPAQGRSNASVVSKRCPWDCEGESICAFHLSSRS